MLRATGVLALGLVSARADVKLPAIFGDHMVLQQQMTLPVWGWADAGEKVTVAFGAHQASATAGPDGKWRVDLPALLAGAPAGTLVVTGKNKITVQDVLVGDVWLCSGQSNMELRLGRAASSEPTDDQLRLFHVPNTLAVAPRADVTAKWEVCSAQSLGNFSAVAYYFGKDLRTRLKRPVGLIESSWGGTGAQEWTNLATLQATPALQHYVNAATTAANFPGGDAAFSAADAANQKWSRTVGADKDYQAALKAWRDASAKAKAAGQPAPSQPSPPVPHPPGRVPGRGTPTLIFNGMIAPIIPFAIQGVIWYQGENNARSPADAIEYRILFPAMINAWRALWKQGDFPFLFVQLANYSASPANNWPFLRESQLKTLALPKTGMAVIVDIGTGGNIHPPDKADVGARLALAARHVAYGEDLAYTGPIYASMRVDGATVRINFKPDSLGGGLAIGTAPWIDSKAPPLSKSDLAGFQIAGADQKWHEARATISGNSVVVSSPEVSRPVAVRYAWADNPACNLYNKAGLPASPFRTDEWPPTAAK